jgi:hypothetical protein
VAVVVVILTPLRLQQPTVVLEGGWRGERMPGVKKHRVVPRPEGVFGIRDSGDGHTPVTTKTCAVVVVV